MEAFVINYTREVNNLSIQKLSYGAQTHFSVFTDTMVEMTWSEIRAAAQKGAMVLLPVGIVEAHGPHLDLSADFYLSTLSCRYMKQELCEKGIEALITPPMYFGVSSDLAAYAGTFSVSPITMKALLLDMLRSLRSWGFTRVFLQNAHGDPTHIDMIRKAILEANELPGFHAYFMWDLDIVIDHDIIFPPMRKERFEPDYHAGAIETGQMAAFFPDKVRMDAAKAQQPSDSFHPLAYCGDPASFDKEINMAAYMKADVQLDVLKIQAILLRDAKK